MLISVKLLTKYVIRIHTFVRLMKSTAFEPGLSDWVFRLCFVYLLMTQIVE